MDADEARAFVREHHRGILATMRPAGRPLRVTRIDVARAGPDPHH